MSTLPQPPGPDDPGAPSSAGWDPVHVPRPGELTGAWRVVFAVGWICVVLAFASVWKSSRTMGLSTWWLGASAEPRFVLIQMLPFVPAVALVVAAARRARRLPHFGVAGALALAGIAAGDLGRFDRLALVELVVAGAALLLSVASFAGLLRAVPATTATTATPATPATPATASPAPWPAPDGDPAAATIGG